MVAPRPLALVLGLSCLAVLFAAGCDSLMWLDYRDEPYLADMAAAGGAEVLRQVNATNPEKRKLALRIVADAACDARRRGNAVEADKLEEIIVRRYFVEKETAVRACIVRICAPLAGNDSTRMPEFLRGRIAAGEFSGYAAMSLAALRPPNALADIEPLTRHPAPEIRYQAAKALTVLGDPRGFDAVCRVWRGMGGGGAWPAHIEGVPLGDARDALQLRARRSFARPLY